VNALGTPPSRPAAAPSISQTRTGKVKNSTGHRSVGASVEVTPGGSVFASWGQAFRAPAVIENACADPEAPCPLPFALGDDPPLAPVKASTLEGGFRYSDPHWSFSGSAYYTDVKDDIFLSPFGEEGEPEGSTIDGFFVNLAKTRRLGLEASSAHTFPKGHSIYLNYSYTRATFESVTPCSRLSGNRT